jgi:hypothetical protein
VWKYLISADPDEVRNLPIVKNIEDFAPSTPEALLWLVGFHYQAGGSGPGHSKTEAGRWDVFIRDRIAEQIPLIQPHWHCEEGNYDECQKFLNDGPCTVYCDPPYFKEGKHYKKNKIDYPKLGEWCQRLGEQGHEVICCEAMYEDDEGKERMPDYLPFKFWREVRGSPMNRNGEDIYSKELIWCSDEDTKFELNDELEQHKPRLPIDLFITIGGLTQKTYGQLVRRMEKMRKELNCEYEVQENLNDVGSLFSDGWNVLASSNPETGDEEWYREEWDAEEKMIIRKRIPTPIVDDE